MSCTQIVQWKAYRMPDDRIESERIVSEIQRGTLNSLGLSQIGFIRYQAL